MFAWIKKKLLASADRELKKVKEEFDIVLREKERLSSSNRSLKEELEDLKLKKKIEEEDIKHLVKIKLEQKEIEYQKRVMEVEKERDQAIERVRVEFDSKLRARLEEEITRIKDMYGEVLQRLPNVCVNLKGNVEGI